jgi:hypothetical protein
LSSYTSSELSREILEERETTSIEIEDLSSITFSTLSTEISDLSSDTSREISSTKSELLSTISTDISTLSSETVRDIFDLSSALHRRIIIDISEVIGGAGESLDTLRELELFVTDLSDSTVTSLISKVVDLSSRETSHFNLLSSELDTFDTEITNQINDLSSRTFSTLSTEISDLIERYITRNQCSSSTDIQ